MLWLKGKSQFLSRAAILVLLFSIMALLVIPGCAETHLTNYDIEQMYLSATEDAEVAMPNEIYKDLTAIEADNHNLVWEGEPGNSRVLVVTWTGKPYYDNYVGQDYQLPAGAEIWVTVVPELTNFFKGKSSSDTELRIEQLLGLPPNSGKTKFVELWADANDMFRPSPDPEITDHEAELDFPASAKFITITETYKTWFNNLKESSYEGDYAHPWTRLGYTYDWGNKKNHIGFSEFVIAGNSTIGIKSITATDDYFKK